jgi:translation elongation factor P/translation initiation factor 5A
MISTNQFKNGNHIEVDGVVFKVLEFQHVKPGKGGAFVRTKLRRTHDGNVIDKTFRAGEKFRAVRTEARKMQFLYADGTSAHFMDSSSYEQLEVPEAQMADKLKWTKPNDEVDLLFIDDKPAGPPAALVGRARGHRDRAGRARRHGVGRRQQARDARDRRDDLGAAVRQHRRPRQGPDRDRRLHVAGLATPTR